MSTPYVLKGEVDLAVAESLRTSLMAYATITPDDIGVDCSGMTFIDAAGLRALVAVRDALAGRQVVLMNLRPQCLRTFEICGLERVLMIKNSALLGRGHMDTPPATRRARRSLSA